MVISDTLIGILIGWLLTQLSIWYKGRKDDKRILKEVLYQLLEIRFLIPKLNINELVSDYKKLIDNDLPFLNAVPELLDQIQSSAKVAFKKSTEKLKYDFNLFDNNLHASITKLSSVNPILAYQLSGHTRIIHMGGIDVFLDYYTESLSEQKDFKETIDEAKKHLSKYDDKSYKQIQLDFEYYIKKVALKVGPLTWLSAHLTIKRINTPYSNIDTISELKDFYKSMGIDIDKINQEYLALNQNNNSSE